MKRIGVIVSKNSEGGLGIPSAYAQYFSNFGLLVPINALDDRVNTNVDMIVLQGGADVNPARYNAPLNYMTQNPNIQMEHFDATMLPLYIEQNIPIFGICRGFQSLNVTLGGTLTQHMWQEYSSRSRDELAHGVTYTNHAKNYSQLIKFPFLNHTAKEGHNFKVNSLHHQGFEIDECAQNVFPILLHTNASNVEAFVVRGKPIVGVQWHPEEIYDAFSNTVINYLLDGNTF